MTASRGSRLAAGAHQWARLAFGLMVVGPSILLVYAWVEVLNNPGLTLVDGYWIGRIPWAPLGVVISLAGLAGAPPAAVLGAITAGSWPRLLRGAAAAALGAVVTAAVLPSLFQA